MQARFYAPWYGRFLSPDPALDQHFQDTQSWNIYSYVRNNPTMKIDPTGMVEKDLFQARNEQYRESLKNGVMVTNEFDKETRQNTISEIRTVTENGQRTVTTTSVTLNPDGSINSGARSSQTINTANGKTIGSSSQKFEGKNASSVMGVLDPRVQKIVQRGQATLDPKNQNGKFTGTPLSESVHRRVSNWMNDHPVSTRLGQEALGIGAAWLTGGATIWGRVAVGAIVAETPTVIQAADANISAKDRHYIADFPLNGYWDGQKPQQ